MKKTLITGLSCVVLSLSLTAPAWARELVAGGQAVGIEMKTEGVMVEGVGDVETREGKRCPAEEAGLREGDLITEINGKALSGAGELIDIVSGAEGESVQLKVRRDGRLMRFYLEPALSEEEQWRLGMWLRDSISGIGTVTFYDPETGIYGALGHGISELKTGELLPMREGIIRDTEISGVLPGKSGAPGELSGSGQKGRTLGSIGKNTAHGIYGSLDSAPGGESLLTGDIEPGPAYIISTVRGRDCGKYRVEINRVYNDGDGRRVMLTVTDPELCAITGGIVQGMSGSPIIQNGRLVGAVTHVFVNDPRRGYGISIQDMLKSAGEAENMAS